MINKQRLQSIISKYHLNGLTQSVKWDTKEGKLDICFVSDNKDLALSQGVYTYILLLTTNLYSANLIKLYVFNLVHS